MNKIIIPIEPKPQMRPRSGKFGVYEDPKMAKWRKEVTNYIIQNYDGDYFDGAISVDVTFYMKAPQILSKEPTQRAKATTKEKFTNFINELTWHDKKVDIDNLMKSVFDSISKSEIVWTDDGLIAEVHARKLYSPNPRIEMEIEQIEF